MTTLLAALIGSIIASAGTPPKTINIQVTVAGFEPNVIDIPKGESVLLKVTRTTKATCATEILIPEAKIKRDLPLDETIAIELPPLPAGEYQFGCGMSMMIHGVLRSKASLTGKRG
jgi:plastocyanin domain-containing protein